MATTGTALLEAAGLEEVVEVGRIDVEAGGVGTTAGAELTGATDEIDVGVMDVVKLEGEGTTAAALEPAKSDEKRAGMEIVTERREVVGTAGMLVGIEADRDTCKAAEDDATTSMRLAL